MKVKYFFSILILFLLLVSISQIFSVPPYGEDVIHAFKSGYFKTLDNQFAIIRDSFMGIKTMSRPEYGWIFLEDIERDHGIQVTVYDYEGHQVTAPGEKIEKKDAAVSGIINLARPGISYEIHGDSYISVMPLTLKGSCRICHKRWNTKKVVGAMRFEMPYDAHVYYASERIILFIIISTVLGLLLYAVIRWDPGKNIKELFDK